MLAAHYFSPTNLQFSKFLGCFIAADGKPQESFEVKVHFKMISRKDPEG